MAKCSLCNSTRNLVYALNPVTFLTSFMCEPCYAKKFFPSEYPRLSPDAINHIQNLPKVPEVLCISGTTTFSQQNHSNINPQLPHIITNIQPDNSFWTGKICSSSNCTLENLTTNNSSLNQSTSAAAPKKKRRHGKSDDVEPAETPKDNGTKKHKSGPRDSQLENMSEFIRRVLFTDKLEIQEIPTHQSQGNKNNDEMDEEEDKQDWPFEWIGDDVKTIKDLIRIGKEYKTSPRRVVTNLDLKKLSNLVEPLETLDKMIGLEDIKASIFKQVVFHLQELDNKNKDMHHTVIKGPPGVGKTQISHIIARIYKGLGFLKNDNVVSVKRDDLIAGYLGQTAMKAKKKYEEALGGVLLIDEAYALGDGSDKDSYSKEAIDLLTSYLSEHGHEFICIIAGYKEALEKRFFSVNEGLARRFNIHYDIKPYTGSDICQIFQKLVTEGEWQLDESVNNPDFFIKNLDCFPHFGGDMLTLFAYTKKAHSTRLLSIRTREELMKTKKKINMDDLSSGFDLFKLGNGYENRDDNAKCGFMYS